MVERRWRLQVDIIGTLSALKRIVRALVVLHMPGIADTQDIDRIEMSFCYPRMLGAIRNI